MSDDLDVFCRAHPDRAAQALRDENQERQNHYSREARLLEQNEDLLVRLEALRKERAELIAACRQAHRLMSSPDCVDDEGNYVQEESEAAFRMLERVLRKLDAPGHEIAPEVK